MDTSVIISIIGILVAMFFLVKLVMDGVNIFLIAFICTAIVALTGKINLYEAYTESYLTGFVGFLKSNFFVFLTGTFLGKAMEITNGAKAISQLLVNKLGNKKAIIAIPIACGILGYGGVSAFVISFAVFPIALQVFKEADLPRNYIPGALCFGCSTFAMVAPGAPQIHNAIVARALGTDIMAGAVNGFIACAFMLVLGSFWLFKMIEKEKANGAHFVAKEGDVFSSDDENLPNGFIALIPLIITVLLINIKINGENLVHLETGLLIGTILTILLMNKFVDKKELTEDLGVAIKSSVFSITNTCAVVGFGSVVQASLAFPVVVSAMTSIPGPPASGVAVGTMVIAGICGSASGGLGIAAPLLGPVFLAKGLSAGAIMRIMAIASSSLDSLPHNGYIVTVTNGICNETHKDAYGTVFKLTVIVPILATILSVILFTLMPNLP
ncbi:GntP family permease [Peptoniphilus stercorisuis]|uniref:H+/gluconate symporter-like permease n=1 Tax=Peptoniphilus stercorisuis TaxID=1436965 RepID=A0ABS4KBV0_9FIRM|nr:GntP family permease [Peptoniphilus stercorisuis]MBP2025258.1 H+/gluconate symporter-like permease [Peptoniphilus stercorisuis]